MKKGAEAIAAAVTKGTVPTGGTAGEIADNPLVVFLTRGLSKLITPILADDQIGDEKVLKVKASKLIGLAPGQGPDALEGRKMMTTQELGNGKIEFNFPEDHLDRNWLFEGGAGSYKVYLDIKTSVERRIQD